MRRSLRSLMLLILLVSLFFYDITLAQEEITLALSEPIIDSFPQVQVFLQVWNETGQPIDDLPDTAFTLVEDNETAPDLSVDRVSVGTRLVYAINTSPALRIRDTLGRSRYELVRKSLLEWWALPEYAPLGVDDLSLITSEGTQIEHTRASADIASVLDNFIPTFETERDFELLFRALDLTNEPAPEPGMPSYIFFITPLLRPPVDLPIENIIARALASQTSIIPILVGPPDILEQAEVEIFQLIAEETGGSLLRFDPDQGLLDLARLMIQQRDQYQLTYRSLATSSGPHEIKVRLNVNEFDLESPSRSYVLELLPPEITLLNLPNRILRASDDPTLPLDNLPPSSQEIEFVVQFPDGYPRPIIQVQLLIDGVITDQKVASPFSPLTWDLRSELENATRTVQVSVLDSLGLETTSLGSEISLEVNLPPRGLAALRPALSSLLIALGVLLGGVALAALLLGAGRRSGVEKAISTTARSSAQPAVTSRVRQELPEEPIEAYLHPLDGNPQSPGTIYLTGTEINIGRDPNFAAIPLDDPSVEGLHARIIRQVDGNYIVRDQGSKAGTWIHYKAIPETGQKLTHGDIVHFGRSAYRFVFANPPQAKQIRITPADDPGESNEDSSP